MKVTQPWPTQRYLSANTYAYTWTGDIHGVSHAEIIIVDELQPQVFKFVRVIDDPNPVGEATQLAAFKFNNRYIGQTLAHCPVELHIPRTPGDFLKLFRKGVYTNVYGNQPQTNGYMSMFHDDYKSNRRIHITWRFADPYYDFATLTDYNQEAHNWPTYLRNVKIDLRNRSSLKTFRDWLSLHTPEYQRNGSFDVRREPIPA